jgi:hypothetical protein
MDFMTYQQMLLLRPLIIFMMVVGLLLVAAVVGVVKDLRKARKTGRTGEVNGAAPVLEPDKYVARFERSAAPAKETPRTSVCGVLFVRPPRRLNRTVFARRPVPPRTGPAWRGS